MSRRHRATLGGDGGERGAGRGWGAGGAGGASILVAVGYLRRSTDRQEQSIPDQKRAIERYAAEHGIRLLRFYIDDAISGTTTAGRRAFQQMIADAQAPPGKGREWSLILVYDIKRFGRIDNDEAGYYRHLLRTHGVEVRYVSEGFNGDATDDLLRPVKQWQARQESKDLSKVTIRGLLSKTDSCGGAWMGGVPPWGYDLRYENDRGECLFVLRYLPDGSKQMLDQRGRTVRTLARGETVSISKRDRARLVLSEASRVHTIRRIFQMYTQDGRGLKAISGCLNQEGIVTPRGPGWASIYAGLWRDSSVRAILVNPIYAGDMVWNRRTDARFHSISGGVAVERKTPHGARLVPNPEQDWIITRDTHEALVERRTFELAQRVREDRPASASQRGVPRAVVGGWTGARARFLLSGLIHCERCGGKYQGVTRIKGRPRKDGSQIRNFYYACGGYIAKGRSACAYRPVVQAEFESAVCRAVLTFYQRYAGDHGRQRLGKAIAQQLGVESKDLEQARQRIMKEQARTEATIAKLLDNLTPGTRDLVEERLAALRSQRDAGRLRLEELDRLAQNQGKVAEMTRDIGHYLAGLEFTLEHGLNEEKCVAIRRAVHAIHLRADRAELAIRTLPLQGVQVDTHTVVIAIAAVNRT